MRVYKILKNKSIFTRNIDHSFSVQFYKFNFNKFVTQTHNKNTLQEISKKFWISKKGDLDSMCGFQELHEEDVKHSQKILAKLEQKEFDYALDVGSGIGRITFNSLYDKCKNIDLLDLNQNFLDSAKEKELSLQGNKIKEYFPLEIQMFKFNKTYDLIFIQWVLEYLSDKELNTFMGRVYSGLKESGTVIIKENVSIEETNLVYPKEGSLIRKSEEFGKIFEMLGFNIIKSDFVKYNSVQDLCEIKYWILNK